MYRDKRGVLLVAFSGDVYIMLCYFLDEQEWRDWGGLNPPQSCDEIISPQSHSIRTGSEIIEQGIIGLLSIILRVDRQWPILALKFGPCRVGPGQPIPS
jgi:hypothetical protein